MNVTCGICGKAWDMRDPGVTHLNIGDEWSCADEAACFDRRSWHLPETAPGLNGPDVMRWAP